MPLKLFVNLMHRSNIKKIQSLYFTSSYFFKHYTDRKGFLKKQQCTQNNHSNKKHLRMQYNCRLKCTTKILEVAQVLDTPQKHKIQHRHYPAAGFRFFCAAAVELPVDPHKVGLSRLGCLYNMVQSKLWKHSIQLLACEL